MSKNKLAAVLAIFALICILSVPAFGDLIDYNASTYSSGISTFNDNGIKGHVDWIVYAPGTFPFSGYTQTPGEFAYVYQIFNDSDSLALSNYSIYTANPADNLGSFVDTGITGTAPLSSSDIDVPGSIWWDFGFIPAGGSSRGLVYSSPKIPQSTYSELIDHGNSAAVSPLPAPSAQGIPEPTMVVTLISTMGFLAIAFITRRTRGRSSNGFHILID